MGMPDSEDADTLGNAETFSELITREQGFLEALVRTIGVPPSDAPDVLQAANLYLVENQAKYQPGTSFRAWAAQVVRYRCLNYFRERKRRPLVNISEQVLDLIAEELVGQFDETEAQLDRLQQCLAKLPAEHRELLAAVYGAGNSLKEYAAHTRKSHAAVRKTISRIRQTLKACIESLGGP